MNMIKGKVTQGMKEYSYVILLLLVLLFVFYTMSSALAADINAETSSIIIKDGDTLWGIAQKYHKGTGLSVQEYVGMVRQMNQLETVTIYPGQEISIMVAIK